jgi:hypothetical protein
MRWREHLRILAILTNILLTTFLVGTGGWFWSVGFGVPFVLAPVLAIAALVVNSPRRDR